MSTQPAPEVTELTATDVVIDQPGVYDLPAPVYHADPVTGGSLSSSGARKLLPPSCPALFREWADSGEAHKRTFDVGHAAHGEVLGVGEPVEVIDAEDYKTKAARDKRDTAYAEGRIPLLTWEHGHVQAMATTLRQHPIAGNLFAPGSGAPEQTLVWRDPDTGIWRRAMLDWLRTGGPRLLVVDYKTTNSAAPAAISKHLHDYGYCQQADWYLAGATALGLAAPDEAAFVFVFQEKTPPYLISVAQPDPESLMWGARLNAKALDVYAQCVSSGRWPGYADNEVISVGLPPWARRQHEDAYLAGQYDPTSSGRTPAA